MTSYVGCYVYTISDVCWKKDDIKNWFQFLQNIMWQSYTNHHQLKSKCVSSTAIRPERPRNNMKPYLVHRRFVPNRKHLAKSCFDLTILLNVSYTIRCEVYISNSRSFLKFLMLSLWTPRSTLIGKFQIQTIRNKILISKDLFVRN